MRYRIKKLLIRIAPLIVMGVALLFALPANAEKNVVRVLLTKLELTDQVTLSLDGSYTVGELSFQRGAKMKLSCASGQIILYYQDMSLNLGKEAVFLRHAIREEQENGLRVNDAYPLYCGDLHLTLNGKTFVPVLHIPIEEYLLGVVPYEMSDTFPMEALKAQAVAARTYALRRTNTSGAYDVVDNTNDQVYRGYQKENKNAEAAVKETVGICGYDKNNALANCYYTASNGGQVEHPDHVWGQGAGSYITMHEDPYDVENPESVVRKASLAKTPENGIVGNEAFTDAVKLLLSEQLISLGYTGEKTDTRITAITGAEVHTPKDSAESLVMTRLRLTLQAEARRVPSLAAQDDVEMSIFQVTATPDPSPTLAPEAPFVKVEQELTVDIPVFTTVQPLLGLTINGTNNEIVTVTESETAFELASRRYGHGVGLSQRGAQWMADQYDWTYDQILRFYYPGLSFKQADTAVALPSPVSVDYLTTPGPPATPTPRPTLMPVTAALKPGEWKAKVTQIGVNSSLNLRSAPGMEGEILRLLYYGQELIVEEQLPDGWLKVKTDAIEGYVMEKFVEKAE
ncbi:MAG: SpoIID/LytB domain-containing protein [Clostridia bacterium]|nr:SpoIID/LytB domain-containing protein [Clostridia bacterium]